MVFLTLSGLKEALEHVHNNSQAFKFHQTGSLKGLIITPEGFTEEMAYHLRLVQGLKPQLITRLAEEYVTLSLAGQELLDVLDDEEYLNSLTSKLRSYGYSAPSDRQVFRLLQSEMESITDKKNFEFGAVFDDFFNSAIRARTPKAIDVPVVESEPEPVPDVIEEKTPEQEPVAEPEVPAEEISMAGDLIKEIKTSKKAKAVA